MTVKKGSVEDGLPPITPGAVWKFVPFFLIQFIISRTIGGAIALSIHKYGKTASYNNNISALGEDAGYFYLTAVVLGFLVSWINMYPMVYKQMIMQRDSGNLRANMMIYKEAGSSKDAPHVILETEGPVGAYNRANRSLTHFTENALSVIMSIILAGQIFPFPTCVLAIVFAVGRIWHQVGYASIGYGAHGPGFLLAVVSTVVLEMLCALVAVKAFGVSNVSFGSTFKLEL